MIRMLNNINLTQIVRQKFNGEGLFLWIGISCKFSVKN